LKRADQAPEMANAWPNTALFVVARGNLDRVSSVPQFDEIDAFDDATTGHIQARNNSFGRHGGIVVVSLAGGGLPAAVQREPTVTNARYLAVQSDNSPTNAFAAH